MCLLFIYETLPKAQRTQGLTLITKVSAFIFIFQFFSFSILAKSQFQNLSLKISASKYWQRFSFRISTKYYLQNLGYSFSFKNHDKCSAFNAQPISTSKSQPNFSLKISTKILHSFVRRHSNVTTLPLQ